jgi:transforming growth factor-beta-induced protein
MKRLLTRSIAAAAVLTLGIVAAQAGKAPEKDIVDTAVAAGSFNTLAAALKAAGLVDTLKGKGPFTVFAPTDAAFAKLPAGTVEDLLKPENRAKLVSILTYHVLPEAVSPGMLDKMTSAKTVEGQSVTIAKQDGKMKVNGADIAKGEVKASNGIIYVIDSVILPQ